MVGERVDGQGPHAGERSGAASGQLRGRVSCPAVSAVACRCGPAGPSGSAPRLPVASGPGGRRRSVAEGEQLFARPRRSRRRRRARPRPGRGRRRRAVGQRGRRAGRVGADRQPQRGDAVLQVGQHGVVRPAGSGSRVLRPDVPAFEGRARARGRRARTARTRAGRGRRARFLAGVERLDHNPSSTSVARACSAAAPSVPAGPTWPARPTTRRCHCSRPAAGNSGNCGDVAAASSWTVTRPV